MFQVLEVLLWMFIDFPAKMNPGVRQYVTGPFCSVCQSEYIPTGVGKGG